MAARRVTQSAVNWAAIAEKIPESAKPQFNAFKSRAETNLRKMTALPEKPPKIDWNFYKARVPSAALVDSFQKKYDTLQIPFPQDPLTAKINEWEKQLDSVVAADIQQAKDAIAKCQQELAVLESQLPITEMTMEEYCEAYPDINYNANDPTPWPHDPEEVARWRKFVAEGGQDGYEKSHH